MSAKASITANVTDVMEVVAPIVKQHGASAARLLGAKQIKITALRKSAGVARNGAR
jgi:hypothetical protein